MTVIALTGITLTGLKYRNESHTDVVSLSDSNDDYDYASDSLESNRINPKFHYNVIGKNQSTESTIVKRSTTDNVEFSIRDRNASMIDYAKRDKVKQVHGPAISVFPSITILESRLNPSFLLPADDDARLEQLQAVRVGQERAEAHLKARPHWKHLRVVRARRDHR
jgi:hypothetical protein